jgi:TDG/mug DNA glycosylase family protein
LPELTYTDLAKAAELSAQEMLASVPVLLAKIARYRPLVLCVVGKAIWVIIEKFILQPERDPSLGIFITNPSETAVQNGGDEGNGSRSKTTKPKKKNRRDFAWGIQPYAMVHSDGEG